MKKLSDIFESLKIFDISLSFKIFVPHPLPKHLTLILFDSRVLYYIFLSKYDLPIKDTSYLHFLNGSGFPIQSSGQPQ